MGAMGGGRWKQVGGRWGLGEGDGSKGEGAENTGEEDGSNGDGDRSKWEGDMGAGGGGEMATRGRGHGTSLRAVGVRITPLSPPKYAVHNITVFLWLIGDATTHHEGQ